MICPKCKEEGKTSRIAVGVGVTTDMYFEPFYDEKGIYHDHDANAMSQSAECSNGHKLLVCGSKKCPNCDFGKDRTIRVL